MKNRNGHQQGEQQHDEGQQGEKTHRAFLDGLKGSEESEGTPQRASDVDAFGRPHEGRHRLHEDRQQHDEAEKNSEANRLDRLGG